MDDKKFSAIVDALWKNPEPKNWERLSSSLGKGKIKYYKVFYEKANKLKKIDDLKDSYIGIYTGDMKSSYKVPLFKKEGKGIRGATIYLKGLLNLNK